MRVDEDEDENDPDSHSKKMLELKKLRICLKCGAFGPDSPACSCNEEIGSDVSVGAWEIDSKEGQLHKCYFCDMHALNIIKRFFFSKDAISTVLLITNKIDGREKVCY